MAYQQESPPESPSSSPAPRKLPGYVGFANLPNQVHKKSVKKGFDFTLLVAGEYGLGKATLVNCLFNKNIIRNTQEIEDLDADAPFRIQQYQESLTESNITLRLTVLSTINFGLALDNESTRDKLVQDIESRYDRYLEQEASNSARMVYNDTRVHACIYFIAPTGHGLKTLDIEIMRQLHTRVNLVPVIAKSDTMTEDEIKAFKRRIIGDLAHHKIDIFVPEIEATDDPETISEKTKIMSRIPFAIVGSTDMIDLGSGKQGRGRKYPWGVVDVDNEDHSDLPHLRQLLIRSHMEELKDLTTNRLYEHYRKQKMLDTGYDGSNPDNASLIYFAEEKKAHDAKMMKMEAEMRSVFEQKVQEKESKLKSAEDELHSQHRLAMSNLEKQRAELEDRKKRLEEGRPGTPEQKKTRKLRW